jgi:hypothetical protein
VLLRGDAWRRLAAKVGTSNSDRTISLRLQCVVKKHNTGKMIRFSLDHLQANVKDTMIAYYVLWGSTLLTRCMLIYALIVTFTYVRRPEDTTSYTVVFN